MFKTARYFIKTAFGFFVLGLMTGLYMYFGKTFGYAYPFSLISAHTHLLLMGGVFFMILGVAVWFFPRARKDDSRYNPKIIMAGYWAYALATCIRFLAEILSGIYSNSTWLTIGFFSALIQVFASITLIYTLWGRIRSVGSHLREEKGERF